MGLAKSQVQDLDPGLHHPVGPPCGLLPTPAHLGRPLHFDPPSFGYKPLTGTQSRHREAHAAWATCSLEGSTEAAGGLVCGIAQG